MIPAPGRSSRRRAHPLLNVLRPRDGVDTLHFRLGVLLPSQVHLNMPDPDEDASVPLDRMRTMRTVMLAMHGKPPFTPAALAEATDISVDSVRNALARALRMGLVRRLPGSPTTWERCDG